VTTPHEHEARHSKEGRHNRLDLTQQAYPQIQFPLTMGQPLVQNKTISAQVTTNLATTYEFAFRPAGGTTTVTNTFSIATAALGTTTSQPLTPPPVLSPTLFVLELRLQNDPPGHVKHQILVTVNPS
jgi:hypothetical protein